MVLRLNDKKQIVDEIAVIANETLSAITAEYIGLTVAEMTELRANAREKGVTLRVVRNTLARRAVAGTQYENLTDSLTGPVILAFSKEAPGAAARLMRDFSKDHEQLKVTAISLNGQLIDAKQINAVANLPTHDEAISKLMAVMKAPIEKLARTLAEPHAKLVRVIAAVRDKKQAA